MASSCSCWFPVYFIVSVTLGAIAISSAVHSTSKNSVQEVVPITHDLSMNASDALRRAGFKVMADLLRRSPPHFFLPPQNSTIFAIKDSAIKNTSLPPWLLKNLLQYHTSTSKASLEDLLKKPKGSCMPTLFRQKNVAITKVDAKERSVEINHVLISDPDIFLGDQLAIHGVLGRFSSLDPQGLQGGWDFIHSATCRPSPISPILPSADNHESKNMVEWNRIVQLLSANGYASFSIALHSVLDGIQRDSMSLGSVTIFAPPDLGLLGSPSPLLYEAVRLHILPQRYNYSELTSLPVRTLLKTLMPGEDLEIDGALEFMTGLVISGVEIVAPDISNSEKFVIHGISTALKTAELLTIGR